MTESALASISRFVRRYRLMVIAGRVGWVWLVTGTLFFALCGLLEAGFALFPWTVVPFFFDSAAAAVILFLFGYTIAAVTFLAPGRLAAARMAERASGLNKPFLSLALELAGDSRTRDNPFADQACRLAAGQLRLLPRVPRARRHAATIAVAGGVLGAWSLWNPVLSPRLLDFWALPFSTLSRPDVVIEPGSVVVPTDAALTLRLSPRSGRYPSCNLTLMSPGGERLSRMALRPDAAGGGFGYRLDSVRNSFLYRFSLGRSALGVDTVTVAPPPRLRRLRVRLEPPAYTRRPGRVLPEGQGNFEAYAGTRASITVESDRLSKAWLVRDRDSLPLSPGGGGVGGELEVTASCAYTFALVDTLGQKNRAAPWFHIECIPDEPPSVRIVKPGFNKELRPEQAETLAVEGIDDIGIRSMALRWRLGGGGRDSAAGRKDLSVPGMPPVIRTAFLWRLTELSLYPGDTVFYWAEITDTKPFGKPRPRASDTFWLRIPTFEEIHRKIVREEEHAEKTIGAVRDRQGEIEEKIEGVMKTAAGRKELSWEQKQILRDVKESLARQSDSLQESLRSLEEAIERMKREGSIGEELAKKMEKVREAVDNLVRQYGDSLLFNLKDIDKPVTSKDLREAIEKVASMLPKLDEQLDNVLKFLDMLKQDRRLADLAMRAERLSKEQASLARGDRDPQAAMAREKELLDQIRRLSEEIAQGKQADSGLKARLDSLRSSEAVDSLRKSMQSALSGRNLPAPQTMRLMSGALLSMSQELLQAMNFSMAARAERERKRLLALSRDALALADWQQELSAKSAEGSDDAAVLARSQQAIKDALGKSRAAVDSLAMIPPEEMFALSRGFDDASAAMERVLGELGSGDGRGAMSESGASLRSLANSALSMISKMDNGQQSQCSGGSCMMSGLGKISGRQAAINSMTSEMLRSLMQGGGASSHESGGNGSSQAMEEARREARKAQQAVADELRKLSEKYGREAGEGLRNKVDALEEEARRLAALFDRPTAALTERQDRFLARMLETTLSMHREGEGKDEWKSRTAETIFQEGTKASPGTLLDGVDAFHRLRQKAFQGNFPEGYRQALRAYFDALSEKYLK